LGQVESSVPNEIPSDKLAQFAADWREEDPEAIPEKVVEMVEDGGDDELVIIEGVRSRTDYDVLSEYFDDFYLLQVKAPFYTRIGRLQERGREGEEKFTAVDLAERDENELYNLGFDALRESDAIDIDFRNDSSLKNLTINLSDICENNLPFEIQDGTEFGLDDEMEQFRKREI
jgi:dephospho-CoA kinase